MLAVLLHAVAKQQQWNPYQIFTACKIGVWLAGFLQVGLLPC
jgi:hypothetical protein